MKLSKASISLFIAFTLALCCAAPAFAGNTAQAFIPAEGQDVSAYPTIYLAGAWHILFYDEHTDHAEAAFDPFTTLFRDTSRLMKLVLSIAAFNYKGFGEILSEMFSEGFYNIRMDKDGESVADNISADFLERRVLGEPYHFVANGELDVTLGENECAFFFDWRLPPLQNAEKLRAFVLEVLEETGQEKVNVHAISGSGQILLCYLDKYGTDKLASAVFNMSLHNGSSLFGGLATRQLGLDTGAMGNARTLKLWNAQDIVKWAAPLLRIIYEIGAMDYGSRFFTFASKKYINKFYEETMIPLWYQIPSNLCMIPTSQYEQAKQLLFKGDPSYGKLLEKADGYMAVRTRQDEIILKAASEIKVAVRAGYGVPLTPFAQGTNVQSDEMVDTAYASIGATCAPINRPFFPGYEQANNLPGGKNYVSPDRLVDASTCLLPDQTWFAKDASHFIEFSYSGWYEWFLKAENYSVWDNPDYPQFQQCVDFTDYVPMEQAGPSMLRDTRDVLSVAFTLVMEAWRKVFLLPIFWM